MKWLEFDPENNEIAFEFLERFRKQFDKKLR